MEKSRYQKIKKELNKDFKNRRKKSRNNSNQEAKKESGVQGSTLSFDQKKKDNTLSKWTMVVQ